MKRVIITMSVVAAAMSATAVTPLWLRDVKISPTGKEVAFTYKGDIYKVPVTGGAATRLTTQSSYESQPVWSPDGSKIAFASDRNGNQDIYIMSANGGQPTRLTYNSANELPESFSPDGNYVIFSAAIQDPAQSALFPTSTLTELYKVPTNGGRFEMVIATPAQMVNYAPDGSFFLYQDQKGMEDEWRKHHTSSVTRDVWMYDTKTGHHKNLTARAGEDRNPVLSPDGNTVYILSERNGKSFNVYSFPINNPASATQVTDFTTHPVRFLSQSKNGTLAFTYDGEIYTMAPGSKPAKLAIDITLDEENPVERRRVSSSSDAAVSPDGKQIAFTDRGEVFVTSVEYSTTKQITNTAAAEQQITWGSDNRSIVYVSERDGHYNLYEAKIGRKEDMNFPNATKIDEQALFDSKDGIERTCPQFSPDGKELAFIQDRNKLMVMNMATKKVRQITDGSTYAERDGGFYFRWSPDGKWITFELTNNGHEPYSDVAIVNTTGEPKVTNITRSSYFDQNPIWVLDGNAIAFASDRYGMRSQASWGSQQDVMFVFLNQDAYDRFNLSPEDYELLKDLEKQQKADKEKADKAKAAKDAKNKKKDNKNSADSTKKAEDKSIKVELDGIQDRIVRITPNSSSISSAIVTKDGDIMYYLSRFEKGFDLWKIDLRKGDISKVNKLDAPVLELQSDKEGKTIYLLGSSMMRKMTVGNEQMKPISYSATMEINTQDERDYMFNYVKQEVANRFYVTNLHGVDWKAMTNNYSKFLPHINNNYDFAEMLSELLGELNCSHTGSRYRGGASGDRTASLGLLYDFTYTGKGLKVAEVIEKGPFSHANTNVKPGVVIEAINGVEIDADSDYTIAFNNIDGKKALVSIYDPASGKRWEEVMLPITSGAMNTLLYDRWVKQRAADVDRLSNGRLGYVHIKSMDDKSYRTIYTDLLGKYLDKEGIVIDTRWNGGGRLHEDIEVLFSGEKYLTQVIRGQDVCDMPSRRWNKPSIMLQCEANYSNAHGTPWVYKHKNMGSLVGMPVPGTMTSVNWIYMQDPTVYFGVPVIGYRTAEGNYLENTQLEPDYLIANDPEVIVTGEDQQLKKAVEVLLQQIDKK